MNPLEHIAIPLLEWYEHHRRALPWREYAQPYPIWVSEIMLQQTRVTAVLGYFTRFMEALPTVADLAAVPEDELLKLWEGLGYYSRARNLQKAARQIQEKFHGEFPETYESLQSLAGIGEYTASAIASIAYGLPYPAVDGNLLRVTARLTGDFTDITDAAMKRKVTKALGEVIPLHAPGNFNQGMMDLGASVCLPNGAPLCALCPLAKFCVAKKEQLTEVLPVRKAKKARKIEERQVFFLFHKGRVAIRQREGKGLLAKLWEFPNTPTEKPDPLYDRLYPQSPQFVGQGRHVFTHIEWHMSAFAGETDTDMLPEGWVWADREALHTHYAVPNAFSCFRDIWEGAMADGGL